MRDDTPSRKNDLRVLWGMLLAIAVVVVLLAALGALVMTRMSRTSGTATAATVSLGQGSTSFSSSTSQPLPDGGKAVVLPSTVQSGSPTAVVRSVKAVRVEIDHARPADLEVTLVSPDGTRIGLRSVGDSSPAAATYPTGGISSNALGLLNGRMVNGTWKLVVRDRKKGAAGKVKGWGLDLDYTF